MEWHRPPNPCRQEQQRLRAKRPMSDSVGYSGAPEGAAEGSPARKCWENERRRPRASGAFLAPPISREPTTKSPDKEFRFAEGGSSTKVSGFVLTNPEL